MKFKNTLNNMVEAGIILEDETDFFIDVTTENQKWMEENYYHVAVYFGLREETS